MTISIHNCQRELAQTPELLERLDIAQKQFQFHDTLLPYCEKIVNPDQPGSPVLVMVLHGAGSVGHDNFAQIRIPAEPLIRFLEQHGQKYLLLFPQCEKGFQWVDVPWSSTSHTLPEQPSKYMEAALALLDKKCAEFNVETRAALGISMGGYGVWDMACRRRFDMLGVMCGGADTAQAHLFNSTRICIYHGDSDIAVPVSRARDMAEALKLAGHKDFRYKEFPETEHNVWDSFFFDNEALPYLFG